MMKNEKIAHKFLPESIFILESVRKIVDYSLEWRLQNENAFGPETVVKSKGHTPNFNHRF